MDWLRGWMMIAGRWVVEPSSRHKKGGRQVPAKCFVKSRQYCWHWGMLEGIHWTIWMTSSDKSTMANWTSTKLVDRRIRADSRSLPRKMDKLKFVWWYSSFNGNTSKLSFWSFPFCFSLKLVCLKKIQRLLNKSYQKMWLKMALYLLFNSFPRK